MPLCNIKQKDGMNIEKRKTKQYIKSLPPVEVEQLLEEYKIPSPHKEILYLVCVEKCPNFFVVADKLSKRYGINMSTWQIGYRLAEALEKFASAKNFSEKGGSRSIIL